MTEEQERIGARIAPGRVDVVRGLQRNLGPEPRPLVPGMDRSGEPAIMSANLADAAVR